MIRSFTKIINHKSRIVTNYHNQCFKIHIGKKYISMDKTHKIDTNMENLDRYVTEINYLKGCIDRYE